jgi:phage tail sheath protein FI
MTGSREGDRMPSTLTYPGVYIEEVRSDVHPITGVATSITAFVGFGLGGPVNEPDLNDQKCKNMKIIAILIVLLLGTVLAVRAARRRRQRMRRVRNDA